MKSARQNAEKLALQNKEMEQRLHQLRSSMQKKKAQRAQPGVIWKSGQTGSISQHVVNILDQNAKWRDTKKVTILGQKNTTSSANPPSKPKSKTGLKNKSIRRELAILPGPPDPTDPEEGNTVYRSPQRVATVYEGDATSDTYNEQASHASFLEALNEWRGGGGDGGKGSSAPTSHAAVIDTISSINTTNLNTSTTKSNGNVVSSLLDGPQYDERANALAFQRAVQSWRTGKSEAELITESSLASASQSSSRASSSQSLRSSPSQCGSRPSSVSVSSGAAQTDSMQANTLAGMKPVEFKFETSSKLTYLEKLMLKRVRKDPKAISRVYSPAPSPTLEEDDDVDGDINDNAFFQATTITHTSHSPEETISIETIGSDEINVEEEMVSYNVEEPVEEISTSQVTLAPVSTTATRKHSASWAGRITVTPEYSDSGRSPTPELHEHQHQFERPHSHTHSQSEATIIAEEHSEVLDTLTPISSDTEDMDDGFSQMERDALLKSMKALSQTLTNTANTSQNQAHHHDQHHDYDQHQHHHQSLEHGREHDQAAQNKRLEAITPSLMNDFEEMERSFT
eukprot:m.196840 g.196840  ORF g.196840 m.196840 type:complete len:570 (-) comp32637_c0_seq1:165-1874(-)